MNSAEDFNRVCAQNQRRLNPKTKVELEEAAYFARHRWNSMRWNDPNRPAAEREMMKLEKKAKEATE